MTREEKQKAIDALKISAPVMGVTQEEFNDCIHILNHVMDWLEQEPKTGYWEKDLSEYDNGYPKHIQAIWKCSECKKKQIGKSNYCPYCGAKMESEE